MKKMNWYLLEPGLDEEFKDYSIPNFFQTGYPYLTESFYRLWSQIMGIMIECLEYEFGTFSILNDLPAYESIDAIKDFYGQYYSKMSDSFVKIDNKILLTDKLPTMVKSLYDRKIKNSYASYSVVRPNHYAYKNNLREEFIHYFQIVIKTEYSMDILSEKLYDALNLFFEKINLPSIPAKRSTNSFYQCKTCWYSLWRNKKLYAVMQCGVLKKECYSYEKETSEFIIDIGGTQRLFFSWILANSDGFGLKIPSSMRNYDALLITDVDNLDMIYLKEKLNGSGIRVKMSDKLTKLKQSRKAAYKYGYDYLVVPRKLNENKFFQIYTRDGRNKIFYDVNEIVDFCLNDLSTDFCLYNKSMEIVKQYIYGDYIYVDDSLGKLEILKERVF